MTDTLVQSWLDGRTRTSYKQGAGELIPTWQQGQEQPRPNDLRKFAEEGYAKNSLLYACVREKATAFSSLGAPRVVSGGRVIESGMAGRLPALLANPNTYQDGAEFAEELKTHDDAAGNVYIHMIERSGSVARRREFAGFPVQELQLIRPDYVTIEPGATREADVFVVTIEGVVRRRIPRADIIHLKRTNPINDFYGLSPIALITREVSIDLGMSDFELAFFRNAGVPMGILKVKGNYTQAQTDEAKSAFRRAFNGFRKWFDVLVINADESEYQQLAIAQSDMEMSNTRALVESRICMVLGVPPLIVGSHFAIESGGQNSVYEQAQFSFWSETMLPESERIARAFTKYLLPRFATSRVSGENAQVRYDYTQVRVLQEDLSRKLREVVRMINTGGVMVSTAFGIVGLTPPINSDFYVRSGNQATVDADGNVLVPAAPAGGSGEPDADNPLEGAAAAAVEVVEKAMALVKEPRCTKCNKLLARALGPGSEVECPRCSEVLLMAG